MSSEKTAAGKRELFFEHERGRLCGISPMQAMPAARYQWSTTGVGEHGAGSPPWERGEGHGRRSARIRPRSVSLAPVFPKALWHDVSGILQVASHGQRSRSTSPRNESG